MKKILILIIIIVFSACSTTNGQSYRNLEVRNDLTVGDDITISGDFTLTDSTVIAIESGDTLTTNEFVRALVLSQNFPSFGLGYQIPRMNASGTDYIYSPNLLYRNDTFFIKRIISAINDTLQIHSNIESGVLSWNQSTLRLDNSQNAISFGGSGVSIGSKDNAFYIGERFKTKTTSLFPSAIEGEIIYSKSQPLYTDGYHMYNGSEWKKILLASGLTQSDDTIVFDGNVKIDSVIVFSKIKKEDYKDGRLLFDSEADGLVFQNSISGFNQNLGYEQNRKVYNASGETIPDGTAVRKIGAHINGDIIASVTFAGISTKDSARVYGVTTVDISPDEIGIVVTSGGINSLNLSSLNDTSAFLGFKGVIIDTCPSPPYRSTYLGEIIYNDNDSGLVEINFDAPRYSPNPTFNASFEEQAETIENGGIGVYELITNATNDLFNENRNVGFLLQGDSISPLQDGNYNIFFSYSFGGTAAQTDLYRIGTFINSTKGYSTTRTASGSSGGGVPFPYTAFLNTGDWISFRIVNQTSGTRDCTFSDGTVTITFSE